MTFADFLIDLGAGLIALGIFGFLYMALLMLMFYFMGGRK
jgi:hypothetical protein